MIFKERKMKTRKNGAWVALAAVLLLTAVLVTNCIEPLEKENGYLRLDFGEGGSGRTIMPTTWTPFVAYSITIVEDPSGTPVTKYSEGANGIYETGGAKTGTPDGTAFVLTVGEEYEITVRAYTEHTGTTVPGLSITLGAQGKATITAAATNTVSIPFGPAGTATGTFSWALTYNSTDFTVGLTSATLEVFKDAARTIAADLSPSGTFTPVNLITAGIVAGSGVGSNTNLPAGTYYVKVTLENTNETKGVYNEVLHIYAGETSAYNKNFNPLLSDNHGVTFTNYNGPSTTTTLYYAHAANLNTPKSGFNTIPSTVPDASFLSGYIFNGWFTDVGLTPANIVTLSSTKVYANKTLWASWTATGAGATITFSLSDLGSGLNTTAAAAAITLNQLDGGDNRTLVFDRDSVPPGYIIAKYYWVYEEEAAVEDDDFVFDNTNDAFIHAGKHTITLHVEINGFLPFTKNFEITVNP